MIKVFLLRGLALAVTLLVIGVLQLITSKDHYDDEIAGEFRATRLWLPFQSDLGTAFTESFMERSASNEEQAIFKNSVSETEKNDDAQVPLPESPKKRQCNIAPES